MRPEEPSLEVPKGRMSRRKMLKRIGAGATIAWTAPVLTSFKTPAFAASPGCDCPPLDCDNLLPGHCAVGFCAPHHGGGGCVCVCAFGCKSCRSDEDCEFGGVCVDVDPNCCCEPPCSSACMLPCGET
jgi:hypothetical protein